MHLHTHQFGVTERNIVLQHASDHTCRLSTSHLHLKAEPDILSSNHLCTRCFVRKCLFGRCQILLRSSKFLFLICFSRPPWCSGAHSDSSGKSRVWFPPRAALEFHEIDSEYQSNWLRSFGVTTYLTHIQTFTLICQLAEVGVFIRVNFSGIKNLNFSQICHNCCGVKECFSLQIFYTLFNPLMMFWKILS